MLCKGWLSSHNLVPGSAMMTPAIGPACHNAALPATMLPSLPRHKPACLSSCMLGQPVIMLPSLPQHMFGWPATIHCLSRCMLGRPVINLPSCHARPVCHNAGLPQRMHSQPALPVCHNASLPQFHMLSQPATMLACHNVCSAGLSSPATRTP